MKWSVLSENVLAKVVQLAKCWRGSYDIFLKC